MTTSGIDTPVTLQSQAEEAERLLIHRAADPPIEELRRLWEERSLDLWKQRPEFYRSLARTLKNRSHPFWAFEVAIEGRAAVPFDPELHRELTHTAVLSLARTGATQAALAMLDEISSNNSDTACLRGRLYKDLASDAPDPDTRVELLEKARLWYRRGAFLSPEDYYPLINVASLSLLIGDEATARAEAAVVRSMCEGGDGADYWRVATLGEACLVLGETDRAAEYYHRAAAASGQDYSSVQSMRTQARKLLRAQGLDPALLDDAFAPPSIVIFTGHRIDEPGRQQDRFRESAVPHVAARLRAVLSAWRPLIGYCSAAPGADILFAEAVLELGGDLHLVLPFSLPSFRDYVKAAGDENWLRRFDEVHQHAASVLVASPGNYDEAIQGPAVFDFVNRLVLGSARLQSQLLEAPCHAVAVWDGAESRAIGGTADCLDLWRRHGVEPSVLIAPGEESETPDAFTEILAGPPHARSSAGGQQVRAILFADVVGFSKLEDRDIPGYVNRFLMTVKETLDRLGIAPLAANNWGDAYYFVFETVEEAGRFAIGMQKSIDALDWRPASVDRRLRFRVALNAGPVTEFREPVTGVRSFSGHHTSRAARIEPIVQEGQIYVSDYFAAMAAADNVDGFRCDFVGEIPLAKGFGSNRLFMLKEALPHPA